MAKQIIFEMPGGEYRALCRFENQYFIEAWFCYMQRKRTRKKWLLFGPLIETWHNIPQLNCWFQESFKTREELKEAAYAYYDQCILLPQRIRQRAMNL